jgi:hypothetical protein
MGMYDIVSVRCPACGRENYFQSKGGECSLATYRLEDAPEDVLSDVNRHVHLCDGCGLDIAIKVTVTARAVVGEEARRARR